MKASTHTEIYRPFEGQLKSWPLRPWVLAWSGIRLGFRKKLPAMLLYSPAAIAALVGAIRVHLMFTTIEKAKTGELPGMAAAGLTEILGDVSSNIYDFVSLVSVFALLAISWYGAGLIAEDKRLGAHLLYFSRPLTRSGYIVGKLLSVMVFGWCAMLLPALLICAQASLSSPNWSFLTQEWHVILRTVAYSLLWVFVLSCLVLAISSLVNRRTIALSLVFGVVFMLSGMGEVLADVTDNDRWELLSILSNFAAVADHIFDKPQRFTWNVEASYWILALVVAGSLALLTRSVRRMEVVG